MSKLPDVKSLSGEALRAALAKARPLKGISEAEHDRILERLAVAQSVISQVARGQCPSLAYLYELRIGTVHARRLNERNWDSYCTHELNLILEFLRTTSSAVRAVAALLDVEADPLLGSIDVYTQNKWADLYWKAQLYTLRAPPPSVHHADQQSVAQPIGQQLANKTVRRKRSTQAGEAEAKLTATLLAHHRYGSPDGLRTEPIGCNELARLAEVSRLTASEFFRRFFKSHGHYKRSCREEKELARSLRVLAGDFAPKHLHNPD